MLFCLTSVDLRLQHGWEQQALVKVDTKTLVGLT